MIRRIKFFFIIFFLFSSIHVVAQEGRILSLQSRLDIKWEGANKIKLIYLIAKDIENIQKIIEMRFSITPDTIYEKDGNKYAEFRIEESDKTDKLEIRTLLEVYQHDLKKAKKNNTPVIHSPRPKSI